METKIFTLLQGIYLTFQKLYFLKIFYLKSLWIKFLHHTATKKKASIITA